jgi:arylformamidase
MIDISPEVSPRIAVFPGDTPFQVKTLMDCRQGDSFGLSTVTFSPHVGAHVDAPLHYSTDGIGIAARDLHLYFGLCQVISVQLARGERIYPKNLKEVSIHAPRVLFKTGSFPDPNRWNDDFNALSAELVEWLAERSVRLVGIDTPSIDLCHDKELLSHRAVHVHDMAILEGIMLDEASDGLYVLSALPLKMKDLDASPVRAVLLPEKYSSVAKS